MAAAEPLHGRALAAAGTWARDLGIHLVAGSVPEKVEGRSKPFNTSVLIGPDGVRRAVYRKIHMFDVDVGDVAYRESETEDPGGEEVVSEVDGVPIGLTICYDLRFPELYRVLALRDARVITVPAAFTERTGRDHWEVLLRARAIENQLFVVAAGQVGDAPPHYSSYGRSMIVDPWGVVLAQAPDTECFITADIDFRVQDEMRSSLPSLRNRRPDAYRWPRAEAIAASGRRSPPDAERQAEPRSAGRSSMRRSRCSPARASTAPESPTSPRRPGSPTASSTTTSTPRTRSSTSSSRSAGRSCSRRSARPTPS